MTSLALILMGTGLIVFFSGRVMVKGTNKILGPTKALDYEEKNAEGARFDKLPRHSTHNRTEREFSEMVKKAMRILYIVGGTCFIIGLILLIFDNI